MNLTHHQYNDASKDRYYVDGKRVPEHTYEWHTLRARMAGQLCNFVTTSRTMANGLKRWTHTKTATY